MKIRSFLLFTASAIAAAAAHAHFVWVEQTDAGPAAFFGEWSHELRETQDGYLKIITAPKQITADGVETLLVPTHDRIPVKTEGEGDVRVSAHYSPEKGDTLVRYHARLGRSETTAILDLELVPVSPGSNSLRVLFAGEPLPAAEVTLFTSEGWSRTFKADAGGLVELLTPWPGDCVAEVAHVAETPGELDGRAYSSVRHVSTLMFAAGEAPAK